MELFNHVPVTNSSTETRVNPASIQSVVHASSSSLSFLFDEILISLEANAIGLFRSNPARREVNVDLARGDWCSLTGMQFSVSREQMDLLFITGSKQLGIPIPSNTRFLLSNASASSHYLVHTPIFLPGLPPLALWLGMARYREHINTSLLEKLNDLILNALDPENQAFKDGDNLPSLVKHLSRWDPHLYHHSMRMLPWMINTAQALGLDDYDIQLACWATVLHDIGKVSLPKEIINKTGPLDENEWAVVKLHPGVGARMIPQVNTLISVREIVRTHHEHYDGKGYPLGLAGEAIPQAARILAVIDAYGAMTEKRPYRKALSHEEAVSRLWDNSGSQFDPLVCQAFISTL